MTPSSHESFTMEKYTTTTLTTLVNSFQPPYRSKTPDKTHTPTGKDLDTSVQKLHPNTVNTEKTPEHYDQTMYSSEDDPEEDSITFDA